MTDAPAPSRISRERPSFTWLVRAGVFANLAVALLIAWFYLVP